MNAKVQRWRDVIVRTFKNWFAHDSTSESAALAFYTVFALAPGLIVIIGLAAFLLGKEAAQSQIISQVEDLIGVAGALFGMVGGFVAPNNYTFADSLLLVSIVLLGGIGNPWGLVVATVIVVVVPEKLQTIQEYRFLLYAVVVIAVLRFRPEGLLPRPLRSYFPGWRP